MTDEERAERVRSLRHGAKVGRESALARGPIWTDYARIMRIVEEMDAEASQLLGEALDEDGGVST